MLESHDAILLGKDGEPGVAHKVAFMWRIQIWAIGLFGTMIGFGLKWLTDIVGPHL